MQIQKYKKTELGEIPEEWNFGTILDNSILKGRIGWQGLTTAEYRPNGEYRLVTGTDFKQGRIDWKNCVYVDRERYDQDSNIQLKQSDVLVTKDGTIGKVAYVDSLTKPATLNTGVFVLRPIDKSYVPLFMYYILTSDLFIKFLNKLKAGSTINHLYQKDFINFRFPIPSLKEQQKIASILSNVDNLIQKTDQVIEQTQRLKEGLMQGLLTKGIGHTKLKQTELGEIPEEWIICKLEDICEIKGGKRLPLGKSFSSSETKYPYLRVADFKNGGIDKSTVKYIDGHTYQVIKNYKISKNDLYFSIAGTVGLVGTISTELDGSNLTENAAKLCNLKNTSKEYLKYFLKSQLITNQIKSYVGQVSQPKLALFRLAKMKILLPPLHEQQKIASILLDIDNLLNNMKNKKEKEETLRKGLMGILLTGKIRVKI